MREVVYRLEPFEIPFGGDVPWDAFFSKHPKWSYQRELRIFRALYDADKTLQIGRTEIRLFKIPPQSLDRVILGADSGNDVERAAQAPVDAPEYSHVRLERAVIDHRNRKFYLKHSDVSEW
jgi:hypothetical protein